MGRKWTRRQFSYGIAAGTAAGVLASRHGVLWAQPPSTAPQLDTAYFQALQTSKQQSVPNFVWQQFGIGSGGENAGNYFHPADPNTLFQAQNEFNTYRSTDLGQTWQSVLDFDGDSQRTDQLSRAYCYAFSLQDPNFGFAGTIGGVFQTTTKGASWTRYTTPPFNVTAPFGTATAVSAITIDPTNDSVIYVGSGSLWDETNNPTSATPQGSLLDNLGKLWKSTDRGNSWQVLNSATVNGGISTRASFGRIFVNPNQPSTVWAFTNVGFYLSTNGGSHWVASNSGLTNAYLRDVTMYQDPNSGKITFYAIEVCQWQLDAQKGTVDAGNTGGIYRGTVNADSTVTWTSIQGNLLFNLADMNQLAIPPNVPNGGFSISSHFFGKAMSAYFGMTSAQLTAAGYVNLPNQFKPNPINIVVNPTDPNSIFVCNCERTDISPYPEGVFATHDGGQTWYPITRVGLAWNGPFGQYWNQFSPQSGVDMTQTNVTLGDQAVRLEPNAVYPWLAFRDLAISSNGVLVVDSHKQTMMSTDGGATWVQLDEFETVPGNLQWVGRGNSNVPGKNIYVQPGTQTIYFTAGENGFYNYIEPGTLATGNSANYPAPNIPLPAPLTPVLPAGVLTSVPPVISLNPYETDALSAYGDEISPSAMVFDPNNANTVYSLRARQQYAGYLCVSTDGGHTWNTLGTQILPVTSGRIYQYSLIFEPGSSSVMYFCVPNTIINDEGANDAGAKIGVYMTTNAAQGWTRLNTGLPSGPNGPSVQQVIFDPLYPGVMYAALLNESWSAGGLYTSSDGGNSWQPIALPNGIIEVNDIHFDALGQMYISCGSASGAVEAGGVYVVGTNRSASLTFSKIFDMPYIFITRTNINNPSMIAVGVAPCATINYLNPGTYFSSDGGATWAKSNVGNGMPGYIKDLLFHPTLPNVVLQTNTNSGFYVGGYTGLQQSISFPGLPNVTYGTGPVKLSATATSGLPVTYTVSGPAVLTGSPSSQTLVITGAGPVQVTASQGGNLYYSPAAPVASNFTVAPAPLNVSAQNVSKPTGAPVPSLQYVLSGLVNNDTAASATAGSPTLSTLATSSSPVGAYTIAVAQGTLTAPNYTIQTVNGVLTIYGGRR